MDTVDQVINEIGKVIEKTYDVLIGDIDVLSDSEFTFISGENSNVYLAKYECRHDRDDSGECMTIVTVKSLQVMLDFGYEEFVPVTVNVDQKFGFVIEAIENLVAADIHTKELARAEENHWGNLIDAYNDRQSSW